MKKKKTTKAPSAASPATTPAITVTTPPTGIDPALIVRAIDAAGAHGAHFQAGQLRTALGLKSGSHEAYAFHTFFKALMKNGIVQPVDDPTRRRNRSFTVADPDRLAGAASDATLGVPPRRVRERRGAGPQRVVRLELQLSKLSHRFAELNRRVRQIERDWK